MESSPAAHLHNSLEKKTADSSYDDIVTRLIHALHELEKKIINSIQNQLANEWPVKQVT